VENDQNKTNATTAPDLRWLIVGAIAGLLAAAYGLLRQDESRAPLPDGAIARVNEQFISRDLYERALARLPGEELDADARARLLERLIDDELLVQRALELGMAQSDAEVRNAIIGSLIASITAEADASSPTDEELAQHLAGHPDRFSYVASLSVAAWQSDDESVAQAFIARLRDTGEALPTDGIAPLPDLPPGLMSSEILRDYLGPAIAAAASDMPVGSSAVFARRGQWLVVQVLDKRTDVVTDLERIRSRVLQDYQRSMANQAIEDYIDNLRQRGAVEMPAP
jgi:parvulin-like peptidyl-prolyl isomerase